MATILEYQLTTIATLMTTELNALANNALATTVGGTGVYSNSLGYTKGRIQLTCAFGTNPSANTGFSVWFLVAIDGTNYEDGSASVTPGRAPDVIIGNVRAVTTTQILTQDCIIPANFGGVGFNTLILNNGTGQALGASGNTLKLQAYTYQNA